MIQKAEDLYGEHFNSYLKDGKLSVGIQDYNPLINGIGRKVIHRKSIYPTGESDNLIMYDNWNNGLFDSLYTKPIGFLQYYDGYNSSTLYRQETIEGVQSVIDCLWDKTKWWAVEDALEYIEQVIPTGDYGVSAYMERRFKEEALDYLRSKLWTLR